MKSTIPRRLASLQSLLIVLGALVVPTVGVALVAPQTAHAAVVAGDEVFADYTSWQIYQRDGSTGDKSNLSNSSFSDSQPDVSPDGSRIAFISQRPLPDNPSVTAAQLFVMNSDGSGQSQLDSYESGYIPSSPRWAPDSNSVVFGRVDSNTGHANLYSVTLTGGSGRTQLTTNNSSWGPVAFSPVTSGDYKIAYNSSWYGFSVMDSNGDNKRSMVDSSVAYSDVQTNPDWSPDGSRLYYATNYGVRYYSSTDNFATDSNITDNYLATVSGGTLPRVSADGSSVMFAAQTSGCCKLFTVSSSGGSWTQLTSGDDNTGDGSWVKTAWPSTTPPSNSYVAVSAPSPSDAPYTRQITMNLSTSGIEKFQYGWSDSDSTAPNTSYLQESTDLTHSKGTLNYLGKYSGSGTTWNGGTTPSSDWYLWVRTVQTGGTPNSWATPLLVHTPRRPVWVGLGDSYSSGHHQGSDQEFCPDPTDSPWGLDYESYWTCGSGLDVTKNDLDYSWVKKAVDSYNTSLHAPTDPTTGWSYGLDLVAVSGAWTSSFGVSGTTPGTDAWASGTAQSASVRGDLYSRYDSWPVVSMTGGGNDAGLAQRLGEYYSSHFVAGGPAPWAVSTSNPATDCPNSQGMWDDLKATQLDGHTLDEHIQDNLQGVVTVATNYAPGVRVLNVGYPYIVDGTNDCSANSGSWHGSKAVVDDMNSDHQAVTGDNVHYISLTASGAFGADPMAAGFIQETRLYGYPHPSADGQTIMSDTSVTDLLYNW